MRNWIPILLLAAATGIAAAAIPGDLDHDGLVNAGDCQALSEVLAGNFRVDPATLREADITEDGTVDVLDLLMLNLFLTPDYLPARVRCLYNGYFLTNHPRKAVSASSSADRHRLYVLHALLIHPFTGRIIGTYPALDGTEAPGYPVAKPMAEYPVLTAMEHPTAPELTPAALAAYWRAQGIPAALLAGGQWVDLQGAVATPGLIDGHFHVTSWAKKIPPEGERFGYYADVSDPKYTTDPADWSRKCYREMLWQIVSDANLFLRDTGRDKILLHGYLGSSTEELIVDASQAAFLFKRTASCNDRAYDPNYLLNRIGAIPEGPFSIPADPCDSDPAQWPAQDYPAYPVLMVHTSGQSCWYNSALLEAYNMDMRTHYAVQFGEIAVVGETPPPASSAEWVFQADPAGEGFRQLAALALPQLADVVIHRPLPELSLHVPFQVTAVDSAAGAVRCRLLLTALSEELLGDDSPRTMIPLYRPIVECIPEADWDAAAAYWGKIPGADPLGSGYWDPRNPYGTNWYNGSDRGITQYFHDSAARVWRPTGYAEHYVMRDILMNYGAEPLTVGQAMQNRRNLAPWCHRHGLTATQDIMFYRRGTADVEFLACEGLSYNHRIPGGEAFHAESGIPPGEPTGGLNLRIGLYYYLENVAEVPEVLKLAEESPTRRDVDRFRPPAAHPEFPGWLEWSGWKLQMDGGPGTRTFFTSAPVPKTRMVEPTVVPVEGGGTRTFFNHGFGLLVTTNVQESDFSSRETGALYWLVRESDPASPAFTGAMAGNYAFLKKGVMEWLDLTVDTAVLEANLALLAHAGGGTAEQRAQLAAKVTNVVAQAKDAWRQTLLVLARVW